MTTKLDILLEIRDTLRKLEAGLHPSVYKGNQGGAVWVDGEWIAKQPQPESESDEQA